MVKIPLPGRHYERVGIRPDFDMDAETDKKKYEQEQNPSCEASHPFYSKPFIKMTIHGDEGTACIECPRILFLVKQVTWQMPCRLNLLYFEVRQSSFTIITCLLSGEDICSFSLAIEEILSGDLFSVSFIFSFSCSS